MAGRAPAGAITERELVAIWKRAILEVDVLAELLGTAIRSNAPAIHASKRLEATIATIPARFAAIMAPLIASARPARGARVRGRKTKPRAGSSAARRRLPASIKRFDAAVDAAVDAAIDAHARGNP